MENDDTELLELDEEEFELEDDEEEDDGEDEELPENDEFDDGCFSVFKYWSSILFISGNIRSH